VRLPEAVITAVTSWRYFVRSFASAKTRSSQASMLRAIVTTMTVVAVVLVLVLVVVAHQRRRVLWFSSGAHAWR
jgi:TRAP-type mannitol/chloroaromatic compound transport system permease small subunit